MSAGSLGRRQGQSEHWLRGPKPLRIARRKWRRRPGILRSSILGTPLFNTRLSPGAAWRATSPTVTLWKWISPELVLRPVACPPPIHQFDPNLSAVWKISRSADYSPVAFVPACRCSQCDLIGYCVTRFASTCIGSGRTRITGDTAYTNRTDQESEHGISRHFSLPPTAGFTRQPLGSLSYE
jgi:hypothetical protein